MILQAIREGGTGNWQLATVGLVSQGYAPVSGPLQGGRRLAPVNGSHLIAYHCPPPPPPPPPPNRART